MCRRFYSEDKRTENQDEVLKNVEHFSPKKHFVKENRKQWTNGF